MVKDRAKKQWTSQEWDSERELSKFLFSLLWHVHINNVLNKELFLHSSASIVDRFTFTDTSTISIDTCWYFNYSHRSRKKIENSSYLASTWNSLLSKCSHCILLLVAQWGTSLVYNQRQPRCHFCGFLAVQDKRWSNRKEKLEADMKILQNKVNTNDAIVYKARWFIMARHEQKNYCHYGHYGILCAPHNIP